MVSFTIGCDPEIFVENNNNKFVSAHGLVEGSKSSPKKILNGAYQVDGMALEFNTDPVPAKNAFLSFNLKIVSVVQQLKQATKGMTFAKTCVAEFDENYLDSVPEEAKELGCDPDYNAYTLEENPRPDAKVNFRTASGHVHFGWGADIPVNHPDHMEICANFVKVLDLTLGLPSVIIEGPNKRRELYGRAGAFRPKPYGVEYRTPSNFWIFSKILRQGVYQAGGEAITLLTRYETAEKVYERLLPGVTEEEVQRIINTSDVDSAMNLYKKVQWEGNRFFNKVIYGMEYI